MMILAIMKIRMILLVSSQFWNKEIPAKHYEASTGFLNYFDSDNDVGFQVSQTLRCYSNGLVWLVLLFLLFEGKIEYREWRTLKTQSIDMYLNDMKEHHPHHRDRFSEQAWLFQGRKSDDIMKKLRERYSNCYVLLKRILANLTCKCLRNYFLLTEREHFRLFIED